MICGHGHEQKFKYPYPRDSKIIQMPYPRAKAIDQNPPIETCGLLRLCNDSEDARFFRGFTGTITHSWLTNQSAPIDLVII